MTLEGIFGVPLDVTATYIVLFTIYGAVLEHSGAGRFFVDWAMAAIGRSGSGVGRRTHRHRRRLPARRGVGQRRRQHRDAGRGGLADDAARRLSRRIPAARSSPPPASAPSSRRRPWARRRSSSPSSCSISYLQVIAMAAIPALLYYLSIFLMVEADSRRLALRPVNDDLPTLGARDTAGLASLRVARWRSSC